MEMIFSNPKNITFQQFQSQIYHQTTNEILKKKIEKNGQEIISKKNSLTKILLIDGQFFEEVSNVSETAAQSSTPHNLTPHQKNSSSLDHVENILNQMEVINDINFKHIRNFNEKNLEKVYIGFVQIIKLVMCYCYILRDKLNIKKSRFMFDI